MPLPALSLSNEHVRLELTSLAHLEGLQKAGAEGELWKLWYTLVPTVDGMSAEIEKRLDLFKQGHMIPLTVFRTVDGVDEIVGMTSFTNIEQKPTYKHAEIGATWYSNRVQRTVVNTAAKYLLLKYAFEEWDVLAVELRTHRLNSKSRNAIERLGAQYSGTLRDQRLMPNGTARDTVVYTIQAHEWPTIKTHLEFKIKQYQ